jgi:hypothetical protein
MVAEYSLKATQQLKSIGAGGNKNEHTFDGAHALRK